MIMTREERIAHLERAQGKINEAIALIRGAMAETEEGETVEGDMLVELDKWANGTSPFFRHIPALIRSLGLSKKQIEASEAPSGEREDSIEGSNPQQPGDKKRGETTMEKQTVDWHDLHTKLGCYDDCKFADVEAVGKDPCCTYPGHIETRSRSGKCLMHRKKKEETFSEKCFVAVNRKEERIYPTTASNFPIDAERKMKEGFDQIPGLGVVEAMITVKIE